MLLREEEELPLPLLEEERRSVFFRVERGGEPLGCCWREGSRRSSSGGGLCCCCGGGGGGGRRRARGRRAAVAAVAAVVASSSVVVGRRRACSRRDRQKRCSSFGAPSLIAKAEALRLAAFEGRHGARLVVASVGRTRRQRRGLEPAARAQRGRGMMAEVGDRRR